MKNTFLSPGVGLEVMHGLIRAEWCYRGFFEANVARMTLQVPSITSGPAVQPHAGMAEEGNLGEWAGK